MGVFSDVGPQIAFLQEHTHTHTLNRQTCVADKNKIVANWQQKPRNSFSLIFYFHLLESWLSETLTQQLTPPCLWVTPPKYWMRATTFAYPDLVLTAWYGNLPNSKHQQGLHKSHLQFTFHIRNGITVYRWYKGFVCEETYCICHPGKNKQWLRIQISEAHVQ